MNKNLISKVNTLAKLILKYLKTVVICNFTSFIDDRGWNPTAFGNDRSTINNKILSLIKETDYVKPLKSKLKENVKFGFLYFGHRLKQDIDIKNVWFKYRGYEVYYLGAGFKRRRLKFQDRFLWGCKWSSPMELSINLINLQLANNLDLLKFDGQYQTLIKFCLNFIRCNMEEGPRNLPSNNHYLTNLLALTVWSEKLNARNGFKEKLLLEIKKQFCLDGSNYEGSTSYHMFGLEILYAAYVLGINDVTIKEAISKALGIALLIQRSDWTIPLIGDNDGGYIFPFWWAIKVNPSETQKRRYDKFLKLIMDNFSPIYPKKPEYSISTIGRKIHRPVRKNISFIYDGLKLNTDKSEVFYIQGLSIIVIRSEKALLTIKLGPIGTGGIGTHDHLDLLSFTFSVDKQVIVDDPGVQRYYGGSIGERGKSIELHNGYFDSRLKKYDCNFGFGLSTKYNYYAKYSKNSIVALVEYDDFVVGRMFRLGNRQLEVVDLFEDYQFYTNFFNTVKQPEIYVEYGRDD